MADIEKLRTAMPGMAATLGAMMVEDGLAVFANMGLTFDQATPSVSVVYSNIDGSRPLKVTLSIGYDDEDEDEGRD